MYAIAPRPPPAVWLITGQLELMPLVCCASLTISLANRSLPPPGPVSTTICTFFGVAVPLELFVPACNVEHAVAPVSSTANATATRRRRVVGFMDSTPLFDGLVDRAGVRGGHGRCGGNGGRTPAATPVAADRREGDD